MAMTVVRVMLLGTTRRDDLSTAVVAAAWASRTSVSRLSRLLRNRILGTMFLMTLRGVVVEEDEDEEEEGEEEEGEEAVVELLRPRDLGTVEAVEASIQSKQAVISPVAMRAKRVRLHLVAAVVDCIVARVVECTTLIVASEILLALLVLVEGGMEVAAVAVEVVVEVVEEEEEEEEEEEVVVVEEEVVVAAAAAAAAALMVLVTARASAYQAHIAVPVAWDCGQGRDVVTAVAMTTRRSRTRGQRRSRARAVVSSPQLAVLGACCIAVVAGACFRHRCVACSRRVRRAVLTTTAAADARPPAHPAVAFLYRSPSLGHIHGQGALSTGCSTGGVLRAPVTLV